MTINAQPPQREPLPLVPSSDIGNARNLGRLRTVRQIDAPHGPAAYDGGLYLATRAFGGIAHRSAVRTDDPQVPT
jgi:hypothetical protein